MSSLLFSNVHPKNIPQTFFVYRFEILRKMKKNQLSNLVIEFSVDLVSIDAKMMFKHDLDHLHEPGSRSVLDVCKK